MIMVDVIFGVQYAVTKCLDSFLENRHEKKMIKEMLIRIKDFNRAFDDTEIDTNSFQEYLNSEEFSIKLFKYIFGGNPEKYDEISLSDLLTMLAVRAINKNYIQYHRAPFTNEKIVRKYISDLIIYLKTERVHLLSLGNQAELSIINEGLSEIIKELKFKKNNEFDLNDDFLSKNLHSTIRSLGQRYTPGFNVETDNVMPFETITESDQFFNDISKKVNKLNKSYTSLKNSTLQSDKSKDYLKDFQDKTKSEYDFLIKLTIDKNTDFENVILILRRIESQIIDDYSDPAINWQDRQKLNRYFYNISSNINAIEDYLENSCYKTIGNPYLLLYGEGGIGKSHLLADVAKNKFEQGYAVILLLGQHFSTIHDPWRQIIEGFGLNISTNEFLQQLNKRYEENKKRPLLIIDALNEGEGKRLWKKYIQKFVDELKDFPNIGFVFSVRSQFLKKIIPEGFLETNNISKFEHKGFAGKEYDAIEAFCDFYHLEEPSFPVLDPEYSNPLFLKLVCKLIAEEKQSTLNIHSRSLESIFSSYLKKINSVISTSDRLNYDENLNVVSKVIEGITEVLFESSSYIMNYFDVYKVVNQIASSYTLNSNLFLKGLIDEGILIVDVNYRDEKVTYFTYERMADYLLADYIYKKCFTNCEDWKKIGNNDKFEKYFGSVDKLNQNKGILDSLATILPERKNIEIFDLLNDYYENEDVIDSFINSLVWRHPSFITENTIIYVNEVIFKNINTTKEFFNKQLQICGFSKNKLNANWLHDKLMDMQLGERDYIWTTFISNRFNGRILNFVNWFWKHCENCDKESVDLIMIEISWCLTSTNRKLRDMSTKVLTKLMIKYPQNIIPLINKFIIVNDPYVVERLCASVFGAITRIDVKEFGRDIAILLYSKVFDKNEIYPHILLRDYVRETIEFIYYKNRDLIPEIEMSKVRPPYKSKWYTEIPSNEEIDSIEERYIKAGGKYSSAISAIIRSMTTEYGRGVGGYGDFGRYIFGSAVSDWSNQFNDQDLSNIAVKRIFQLGYQPNFHGEFDRMGGTYYDRGNNQIERIGKKYQWMAFHEVFAKLADNFPTFKEETIYDQQYEEYRSNLWKKFIPNMDLYSKGLSNDSDSSEEMKEKDHIVDVKKIKVKQYTGPWEPLLRDIDPTLLIENVSHKNKSLFKIHLPDYPTKSWVMDDTLFEDTSLFLEAEYQGEKYLILYSSFDESRQKKKTKYYQRDSIAFLGGAFFIRQNDKKELLSQRKHIEGNGVPNPSSYSIFLHEYYWSQAYLDLEEQYNEESEEKVFSIPATFNYSWETGNDYSKKEGSISFNIPCKELVDYFGLHSDKEGVWKDKEGNLICFDSSLLGYERALLFNKEKILKFMNKKKMLLMWGSYTEKVSNGYWHEWWYTVDYNEGKFTKYITDQKEGEYSNDML